MTNPLIKSWLRFIETAKQVNLFESDNSEM